MSFVSKTVGEGLPQYLLKNGPSDRSDEVGESPCARSIADLALQYRVSMHAAGGPTVGTESAQPVESGALLAG